MPARVRTAMRSLLLSTANVPGTEGRKTSLRFNGHGNNICFGASTFFVTPNFADTYNPLMVLLHKGPAKTSHLNITKNRANVLQEWITHAEPEMPPLERMHQIGAARPRAQAKFFLLMTELHYRFLHGLDQLFIGRTTLARPIRPRDDHMATSLQPSLRHRRYASS